MMFALLPVLEGARLRRFPMVVEHSVTEVVLFCVLIIVCLWCDLHAHQADKPVSARNAAIWSCIWVGPRARVRRVHRI